MERAIIDVRHLFPLLERELILLLKDLNPGEWQLPTLAKQWCVKDVAAHLLDGNIRSISAMHRHHPPAPTVVPGYTGLVDYLNQLNAEWVNAMKRVSPQQLVSWLENTGRQYCNYMAAQPLYAKAPYAVAWAGESESINWFHIAREYTEKMHHQLQIREAVGKEEPLLEREFFYPFIATLMYGLPHALAPAMASAGTLVKVEISSGAGGTWWVKKSDNGWYFEPGDSAPPQATIVISPAIAWKLFTKGMDPVSAISRVNCEGDESLCLAVMRMVAVMA